ncbi:hypothetical protein D3C80_1591700 [compost metagenome]
MPITTTSASNSSMNAWMTGTGRPTTKCRRSAGTPQRSARLINAACSDSRRASAKSSSQAPASNEASPLKAGDRSQAYNRCNEASHCRASAVAVWTIRSFKASASGSEGSTAATTRCGKPCIAWLTRCTGTGQSRNK